MSHIMSFTDTAKASRGLSRPPGMPPKKAAGAGSTTVSVVVRVRPPLREERHLDHCVTVHGEQVIVDATVPIDDGPQSAGEMRKSNQKSQMFECDFDQVLDITASQEHIWEALRAKAEAVLDGYNVTFLTYGMTGSGKTYTMIGPELMAASWSRETGAPSQDSTFAKTLANCPHRGLIVRAAQMIFEQARGDVRISMSYLQIYQEKVFDLLQPAEYAESLKLRDDAKTGGVVVEGLIEAPCRSAGELFTMLLYGSQNRAFRSTIYNEQSSRSHAVLTLHIEQVTDAASGTVRSSKLHMVDLAGNEKWDIFGPKMTKEHTKELTSINKSLSSLGNCIQALTQAASAKERNHIPYRDSKLTHLLRDSLGGNGYTVMLCTICGCSHHQLQTISTLRFADRAKRVKMQAKVNETVDMSMLVKKYKREVSYLRGLVGQQGSEELQKQVDDLEKQNQALQEQVGELEQQNRHLQDQEEVLMASSKGMAGGRYDGRTNSQGNSSDFGRSFFGRSLRQAARLRRTCSEPDILFRLDCSVPSKDFPAVIDTHVSASTARGRSVDVHYASERLSSAPVGPRPTIADNPEQTKFQKEQPPRRSKWGVCQVEADTDLPRPPLHVARHEMEAEHGEAPTSHDETLAMQLEEENRALRAQIQASTLAEKLQAQNQALRERLGELSATQAVQSGRQVQKRPPSATRGDGGEGAATRGHGSMDAGRRTKSSGSRAAESSTSSSRGFRVGDESPKVYSQSSRLKAPQGGPRRRPNTKSPARQVAYHNMSQQQQQAQMKDLNRQQRLLEYYNTVNEAPEMEHQSIMSSAYYAGSTTSSPSGPTQRLASATAESAPASEYSSEACNSASSSASTTCSTWMDRRPSAIRDPGKVGGPKQVTLAAFDDNMMPLPEHRASASTGLRHGSAGPTPAHGHQSRRLPPLPREKLQAGTPSAASMSTPKQTARQFSSSVLDTSALSSRSPRLGSSQGAAVSSQIPPTPRSPPLARHCLAPVDPTASPGPAPCLMPSQQKPGGSFYAPLSLATPPSMVPPGPLGSSTRSSALMPGALMEACSAPLSSAPPSLAPPPGPPGAPSPRWRLQSPAQIQQAYVGQASKAESNEKARTPNLESDEKVHTPAMNEAEPERPQSQQRPRQVAPSLSSLHSRLGINSLLPDSNSSSAAAEPRQLTYEAIVKEPPPPSSSASPDSAAPQPPEVLRTTGYVAAPTSAAPAAPRRPVFPKVSTEANPMRALLGQLDARRELEDLERMQTPDAAAVPAA